jgi:hypothetical protein
MRNPSSTVRSLRRGAVALCAITVSACGPLRMGSAPRAMIIFTNEALDQADVYATTSGTTPVRIGTVLSMRTDTLYIPASMTGQASSLNILARPLSKSITAQTGAITLAAGESLRVRFPADERTLIVLPDR